MSPDRASDPDVAAVAGNVGCGGSEAPVSQDVDVGQRWLKIREVTPLTNPNHSSITRKPSRGI